GTGLALLVGTWLPGDGCRHGIQDGRVKARNGLPNGLPNGLIDGGALSVPALASIGLVASALGTMLLRMMGPVLLEGSTARAAAVTLIAALGTLLLADRLTRCAPHKLRATAALLGPGVLLDAVALHFFSVVFPVFHASTYPRLVILLAVAYVAAFLSVA